ncbi:MULTISPECIES: NtaA/DmoA family FMN-dependent monooxygenase [Leifsonia]|uniref:FMN-dependent oxidoreductase (Nitrilotriacetate monooxygenase family) n=1 Tax=Leifsonia soli TaxID=582665 RepID=A0A852T488_9MICO|nr:MULTISPECIES: NtaA/DmoA family FMN-dependent monooxygenase [Leifsonia]NYD75633.1 FMN-dependent oxidoreductase (nitrilotriacetate monooxygenase family) [Leifsonia soli]SEB11639.1 FMN-dependent oxidoreductase, nitrilotriacetate monooxygenase family [Leifsonia sp. 21MFCrub1.1]
MARLQHFGWFFSRGFGPQGWGHPYWEWGYDWTRPDLYQQSARELEQAGLDLVIIEDALSLGFPETVDLRVREAYGGPKHDPLILSPYLLDATRHLGVAPTINAGAYPPYVAARQFATLHHLSGHRLGVNVVTDVGSARHLGLPPLSHDAAYDRAEEWLTVIRRLWHSWDDGALVQDAATRHFADGSKIRGFQHEGEYFRVAGPLNAVPFTDGDPAIVSPGGSPRGIAFAGTHSEVQLALAPLDAQSIRDYRTKVREAAIAAGRTPDSIKVLFVFKPEVVSSDEEARRVVEASKHPTDEELYRALAGQSSDLETDLTVLSLDEPFDVSVFGDHVSQGSIKGLFGKQGIRGGVTLRELIAPKVVKGRIADRAGFVGTAEQIADFIEEIGEEADNDGFIFSGDLHPVTLHRYLDELVPVLRRRGILRTEYGNGGIRGNLSDF